MPITSTPTLKPLWAMLSNARPETKEIGERIKRYMEFMPFDVKEFLEFEIPGSDSVGDWGR